MQQNHDLSSRTVQGIRRGLYTPKADAFVFKVEVEVSNPLSFTSKETEGYTVLATLYSASKYNCREF